MFIFSALLLMVGYVWMLVCCLGRGSVRTIVPSTFFAASIALQCSPLFLIGTEGGNVVSQYFEVSVMPVALLLVLGYYTAAILYFSFVRTTVVSEAKLMGGIPWAWTPTKSVLSVLVVVALCVLYVFATPRYGMLVGLIKGLMSGSSQELNEMRRYEFATGFFYTKVFTWIRYSISPLLALLLLSRLKTWKGWRFAVVVALSYLVYFVQSASFHKASWILGFAYVGLYWALDRYAPRMRLSYGKAVVTGILAAVGVLCLLVVAYYFQYRENQLLTWDQHLIGGVSRLTDATPWGLAAFYDTFPGGVGFLKDEVLFAPFISDARSPEAMVGLSFGIDTTIQAGVLANLYAGVGWYAIPIYWILTITSLALADKVVCSIEDPEFRRIFTVLLGISVALNVQSPLYPSIFSSGLFLNCVAGVAVLMIQGSPPSARSGVLMRRAAPQELRPRTSRR